MSQFKNKYKKTRSDFKSELTFAVQSNKALAMLIVETYAAWKHKNHIAQIWSMFKNPDYENFNRDYSNKLMGKYLSGRVDIWRSLYFGGEEELYKKYKYAIPETFAMGDALGVAYKYLRNQKRKER
ncbi:hypothetical protein [Bacillus atrophaeus]|uniref:hypothetical protein n=1 Tax=Bacillus atrophaeus TaxID=1452 RepID=UPI002E203D69|nr:hypothetical protein [Bacillus atrophaeus]